MKHASFVKTKKVKTIREFNEEDLDEATNKEIRKIEDAYGEILDIKFQVPNALDGLYAMIFYRE